MTSHSAARLGIPSRRGRRGRSRTPARPPARSPAAAAAGRTRPERTARAGTPPRRVVRPAPATARASGGAATAVHTRRARAARRSRKPDWRGPGESSCDLVLADRRYPRGAQVRADRLGDEARRDRRAVVVQDRHELGGVDAEFVDEQRAQLAVAVLLDEA